MFSPENIEKEVKAVFGNSVKVRTDYHANFDGVLIYVYKRTRTGMLKCETKISALEELNAYNPLDMLREYIKQMYEEFQKELQKHISLDLSEKMSKISNARPLWQKQLSQYKNISGRRKV